MTDKNDEKIDLEALRSAVLKELNDFKLKDKSLFSTSRVDNFNSLIGNIEVSVSAHLTTLLDGPFLDAIGEEIRAMSVWLDNLMVSDRPTDEKETKFKLHTDQLKRIDDEIQNYEELKSKFAKLTFDSITATLSDVKEELTVFKRLRNIADNSKTENIYDLATKKYEQLSQDYRNIFYSSIGILLGITLISIFLKPVLNFTILEFWLLKSSVILVGIILMSFFLKQSIHYQRLADQNYQTQVELQAFPSFMNSVPTSEAAAIRKELALKYFGREVDGSAHKDMSNLISDQIKNTTELLKASTDAVKNIKKSSE